MMNKFFIPIAVLCLLTGCMSYYKVQTDEQVSANALEQFDSQNRYIILHCGDSAWHVSDIKISENAISGNLTVLPAYRFKFKTTKPNGGTRYKHNSQIDESFVFDEVHLYLLDSQNFGLMSGNNINVPLSSFSKAEVYVKDKGKTRRSWLIPILIVPVYIIIEGMSFAGVV